MNPPHQPGQRIAIVGSGISGLTCAYVLGPHREVVLYEADERLGGHANTVTVDDPKAGTVAVDTGFIVHNDRNYPNFVRLMEDLGIATIDTEMSFSVTDIDPSSPFSGFTYRATNLNTLFADRRNVVRPSMWRMLRDIRRFYRQANTFLADPDDHTTMAELLARVDYSDELIDLHLVPMGAAIWSANPSTFMEYPAKALLTFLSNHGLLSVGQRPQWRTIPGGSKEYVQAIADGFSGKIRTATPVRGVRRIEGGGVEVQTDTDSEIFDRVVLATHSDQSRRILLDPTPDEAGVLEAVPYQPNRATLHTDTSLLPPRPRAWAAWNYLRREPDGELATVTYDLTTLQHLPGAERYLVTLNSDHHIDPDKVIASFDYDHPVFNSASLAAQARFEEIDGAAGVHFCGAWWGNGFHEDGMVSALRVCERLGVSWPLEEARSTE